MTSGALILKRPPSGLDSLPILVSIPHYGTEALPHIRDEDYAEPWFRTFTYGFADTFVGDANDVQRVLFALTRATAA